MVFAGSAKPPTTTLLDLSKSLLPYFRYTVRKTPTNRFLDDIDKQADRFPQNTELPLLR